MIEGRFMEAPFNDTWSIEILNEVGQEEKEKCREGLFRKTLPSIWPRLLKALRNRAECKEWTATRRSRLSSCKAYISESPSWWNSTRWALCRGTGSGLEDGRKKEIRCRNTSTGTPRMQSVVQRYLKWWEVYRNVYRVFARWVSNGRDALFTNVGLRGILEGGTTVHTHGLSIWGGCYRSEYGLWEELLCWWYIRATVRFLLMKSTKCGSGHRRRKNWIVWKEWLRSSWRCWRKLSASAMILICTIQRTIFLTHGRGYTKTWNAIRFGRQFIR